MASLQTRQVKSSTGGRSWCLPAICLAAGLAGLSVMITGPILVDIATSYGITVALAGQLMTVASFAGMGGTLGLSPLLDRIGRRQAIAITLAVMAVANLACAAAPTFPVLCAAYGLVGLCGYTLIALALAAIGDLYHDKDLGKAMGWLVAGNMGVVVLALPVISTLATEVGWPFGFVFYAVLAVAVGAFVWAVLPGDLCPAKSEQVGYVGA
ncbi:MAG: MFS transporter, partial [Anaerolineae bacterium]